ncbi:MAG: DUF2058 domain-containing protein [Chromatiales bacterium]|jgi:uncharacterized protein YaiL (DUF2058 family)|nr:DUF2058 domain-containing protein [Chromatiales bacterium]MDX9766502.1 DUF2058 domain-containing protein [Ectothiorhodospiraceae bacterium]
MSSSLQEQLLKAGLVDEQRLRKARQEQRKPKGPKPPKKAPRVDERAEQARRLQAEKAERDRELNRQREEAAARKALNAQIRQMVEASRLPKGEGDLTYNFVDGQKIRRIHVTPEVHARLVQGGAGIVKLDGRYEVVPAEVAEKIRERDANRVVGGGAPAVASEEDDAYAKFKVPDDLMW